MTAKDQVKLLKAGFTIIRADFVSNKIKAKTRERPEWHNHEAQPYHSKTGMRKRMDELLNDEKTVED